VGRLVPYKGVELLLRAMAVAAKQCRLHLDIAGSADPVHKDFLRQLAGDLGLRIEQPPVGNPQHATINFLPPRLRNELVALYQQADVFCFPTLCDTYGIALLEAMSCGCAPLVSDVAGAGEIVNGKNGWKVPLRSPEQYIAEYAEKIVALAQNRQFMRNLGEAARQYILCEHDWNRIGDRVLEIYGEFEAALKDRN